MKIRITLAFIALAMVNPVNAKSNGEAGEDKGHTETIKCRSVAELGSRIGKRVCRSQAEWSEIDRQNQETLEERKRSKASSGTNPA